MKPLHNFVLIILGLFFGSAFQGFANDYNIHGRAWADFGRIMHVSDTLYAGKNSNNFNVSGNGIQSLGAQFSIDADFNEYLEGSFGFGAQRINHSLASGQYSYLTISMFQSFLAKSYLKGYMGGKENPVISFTLGSFQDKYNPYSNNLGLYLHRGPVYPGVLMGGWGDFYTDSTKSPILGLNLSHYVGGFKQSLILNSERDIPPTFDWSLSYMAQYKLGNILTIGGGANFYRLIPYNKKLQAPGKYPEKLGFSVPKYVEIDSIGVNPETNEPIMDTLALTHQGIKLVGFLNLDLKPLLGIGEEYSNDLVLYSEAALIGLANQGKSYSKRGERVPIMFGFNLPTFGFLDLLSIEVEWYGAKYKQDLANVGYNNMVADWTILSPLPEMPSPKPVSYETYGIEDGIWVNSNGDSVLVYGTPMDVENLTADDFKWSVNIEKIVADHVSFSAQIANDHFRPRPVATGLISSVGGTAPAFSGPKDWYFVLRTSYFF